MPQYVQIELGNKTRRLRYDYNAVADVEEKAGVSIFTMMGQERMGFNSVRLLTWAGLKHEDKGLTVDRVGAMLQKYCEAGKGLADISGEIIKALEISGVWVAASEDEEGNVETEATS